MNFDEVICEINKRDIKESTKIGYRAAVTRYVKTGRDLGNLEEIKEYMKITSPSSQAFLSAALNLSQYGIKPQRIPRRKSQTWLTKKSLHMLILSCDAKTTSKPENPLTAQRDKIVIRLLAGAGLRRAEAAKLEFTDLYESRGRYLLHIKDSKTGKRNVPISTELARHIDDWREVIGDGKVLRVVGGPRGNRQKPLSTQSIYNVICKRGEQIGIKNLAPHDLRRTFAILAYEGGADIMQIAKSLGDSVGGITRYIFDEENIDRNKLDLFTVPSDFIPME